MSLENAKLFLEKVVSDNELRNECQEKEYDEVVARAKELGYEFTVEEMKTAINEKRKESGNAEVKLDAQDLDSFAGGALWMGEDASDGHEMGCIVSYHHEDWCREHHEYCSQQYYCVRYFYDAYFSRI